MIDALTHSGKKLLQRRLSMNPSWIPEVIQQVRRQVSQFSESEPCCTGGLSATTEQLKNVDGDLLLPRHRSQLVMATAAVCEAVRRTTHLQLYDVQLYAGLVMSCGAIAELQTGEGKTLASVLPTYLCALSGRGVHVVTPNAYLAQRDFEILTPVFALLGLTTGLLREDASAEQTRSAYRADITFATGQRFGFDYLRDQLTLQRALDMAPGQLTLLRLAGSDPTIQKLQRRLSAAIVDEIDHVLLDDALAPLVLSGFHSDEAADAQVHLAAYEMTEQLSDEHFGVDADGRIYFSQVGLNRLYDDNEMSMHPQLLRPWHEYVLQALNAKLFYKRDVQYVVREQQVNIVDAATGRIYRDRTWSSGLQQAIQARERIKIRPESQALASITRQQFFRGYAFLAGMTGTAAGCESEFSSVYGLPVVSVSPRIPSRRTELPTRILDSRTDKYDAIALEAERFASEGRAVLIGTLNVVESRVIAERLQQRGLRFELLNGIQDADEAALIAKAGKSGAITVATSLAGRGTDIKLDRRVFELGGLHVIVSEMHSLARVDRQLIGRCARCGDPGSCRRYVSTEDELIAKHAPWLLRELRRISAAQEGSFDQQSPPATTHQRRIEERLLRIQNALQNQASKMRRTLINVDREKQAVFHKQSAWQPHTRRIGAAGI
jgi:preprotein translocase subunit SecA